MKRWQIFGITEIPDHDDPTRTYLKRWRLIETPLGGIKIHHIMLSDNPATRGLHDHPWDFISIKLKGGYLELTPGPFFDDTDEERRVTAFEGMNGNVFSVKFSGPFNLVRSTDQHAVRLTDDKPCWTLVINGPRLRKWGFRFPSGQWTPWDELPGPSARNIRGHAGSVKETT